MSWLRTKSTVVYLGLWEKLNNVNFNFGEFTEIKNEMSENYISLSPKKWVERTGAIGIISKAGKYSGGTLAHKDIALEFLTWISAEFKLYFLKEFQRLKENENSNYNPEWETNRIISKRNYQIQTDAVDKYLTGEYKYQDKADLLNIIMFGKTAKEWKDANPDLYKKGMNMRDTADINEITILSNLESENVRLLKEGLDYNTRFKLLMKIKDHQLSVFNGKNKKLIRGKDE